MTDETIRRYRAEIERLMPMLGAPAQWDAATLRDAFERRSKEIPGSASLLATIMRSYLRFLIGRGQCRPALLHAMPSVRRYRLSALPRYIDPATIERIIAACPTGRPVEVRDKAIILLLARLGLRAGDIRDMRLDDIDWRSGHLKVKGKTRRPDRLPLPQGVGDAILAYLVRPARRPSKRTCSCVRKPRSGHSVRQPRSPATLHAHTSAAGSKVCRPDRTYSGIRLQPTCCALVQAWSPSGPSCATARPRPPPFTPRPICRCS